MIFHVFTGFFSGCQGEGCLQYWWWDLFHPFMPGSLLHHSIKPWKVNFEEGYIYRLDRLASTDQTRRMLDALKVILKNPVARHSADFGSQIMSPRLGVVLIFGWHFFVVFLINVEPKLFLRCMNDTKMIWKSQWWAVMGILLYSYHFCATATFQVVDPSPMIPHEILRNLGLIFFFPDGHRFQGTHMYKHTDTDSRIWKNFGDDHGFCCECNRYVWCWGVMQLVYWFELP